MKNKITILMALLFTLTAGQTFAQVDLDFEPAGTGAGYTWTVTENGTNPPMAFIANPDMTTNTSATVAEFTAEMAGQTYALCFTDDMGTVTFDATNATVKIMVWKPVISNVGIKFETPGVGAKEVLVANTVTNQWEELTFDFSSVIGESYTRVVIIPDFAARAQDNTVYFDNLTFSASSGGPVTVDVTFSVDMNEQATPATTVNLGADFDAWTGSIAMADDNSDGVWEVTLPIAENSDIQWKFIKDGNWEELDSLNGQSCVMDFGGFVNRTTNVGAANIALPVYYHGRCESYPVSTKPVFKQSGVFEIAPTLVNDFTIINFNEEVVNTDKQLQVVNAVGQVVMNETIGQKQQYRLDASQLSNGLYFVVIQSEGFAQTARILVSK